MTAAVPPLTAPEVARIAAIAGRLASDHDGEALNAARMFCRSIGKHGLRPEELVASALAPKPIGYAPGGGTHAHASATDGEHRRQARECMSTVQMMSLWTGKEVKFLGDMLKKRNPPTPAQAEWLAALVGKARAARGGDI